MSRIEKLMNEIKSLNKDLRFEELVKVLVRMGYSQNQPRSGSSHYTFRKSGKMPITIPKSTPVNKAYIEMVKNAILEHESEAD
ncbi:MAG: hypothetical protein FWF87_02400 [Synergistaceae bacterium]|nr:hypothetical protein [Synergistaceae bacterium]